MVLVKLVLFYFSIEFSKHLISCVTDVVDLKTTSNDLVFNLKHIKIEDYTINELKELVLKYRFIPKGPKIITEVKINDKLVWKKSEEETIVDIEVYITDKSPHTYILNINDKTNGDYSIHFHYHNTLKSIGMLAFLHLKYNSLLTTYIQEFFTFNLKNSFDYKYHKTEVFKSSDSMLKSIIISPRSGYFIDIYDNLARVSNIDKSVEKIKLSKNEDKDILLKLDVKDDPSTTYLYYKYHENAWHLIDDKQYNNIYGTNKFESALDSTNLKIIGPVPNLDIVDNKDLSKSDVKISYANFMLIPTIVYNIKTLQTIIEGRNPILTEKINNAEIYVFRNPQDIEIIEIVHTNSDEFNTRRPNYYYIKEGGVWRPTKQVTVIQKLMEQTVLTLREKGAPEDLITTVEGLHLKSNKGEVEKINLDVATTFVFPVEKEEPVDPPGDQVDPYANKTPGGSGPPDTPDDPLKPKIPLDPSVPPTDGGDKTGGVVGGTSPGSNSGTSDPASNQQTNPPADPLGTKVTGTNDNQGNKPPLDIPPTGGNGNTKSPLDIPPVNLLDPKMPLDPSAGGNNNPPSDIPGSGGSNNVDSTTTNQGTKIPPKNPATSGDTNKTNLTGPGQQNPKDGVTNNKVDPNSVNKKKGDFFTNSVPIISSLLFYLIY